MAGAAHARQHTGMSTLGRLDGRVALITGAGNGMRPAASLLFASPLAALVGPASPSRASTARRGGVRAVTGARAIGHGGRGPGPGGLWRGPIGTPLLAGLPDTPVGARRRLVHIPMGRPGRAEEVA